MLQPAALRIALVRGSRHVPLLLVLACAWLSAPVLPALAAEPPQKPPEARPSLPRGEPVAAREQARLCERLAGADAVEACRAALSLGIGSARRGPVRTMLAKHLASLERWDELAGLFREGVRLEPGSAEAWQRLGDALLFALGRPAEAVDALQQATRLAPADAPTWLSLGLAQQALQRPAEAVAALEEALRLDPQVFDGRPAARAALDAARQGRSWP